jgi:hypothetical protein
MLIGILLGMPFILSIIDSLIDFFVPGEFPPDWLGILTYRLWDIPNVVVDFLLSKGFLPGPKNLYLDTSLTPTDLSWLVGSFVILTVVFFINYIFIKIVDVFQSGRRRHAA